MPFDATRRTISGNNRYAIDLGRNGSNPAFRAPNLLPEFPSTGPADRITKHKSPENLEAGR